MKIISWNTTNACNMYCAHCYRDAGCKAEEELSTAEAKKLLTDKAEYSRMAESVNPYGDGKAAARIIQAILYHYGLADGRPDVFEG